MPRDPQTHQVEDKTMKSSPACPLMCPDGHSAVCVLWSLGQHTSLLAPCST